MYRISIPPERLRRSGLNDVPKDWDIVPLGSLCKAQYGLSIAAMDDGNTPMLGMQHVVRGFVESTSGANRVTLDAPCLAEYRLTNGDVLFNRTNSFDQIGKTGIYVCSRDEAVVFASYLIRLRCNSSVTPAFVNQFMNCPSIILRIKSLATPGVSQFNINPTELLKRLLVPLPSISEQTRITKCLATWDHACRNVEILLKTKRRLKRGLMQHLLTGRRRFAEFAGKPWREVRIGEVLEEQFRPVTWSDDDLYRLASVRRNSKGLFWREALYGRQIKVKKLHAIRAGDFLLSHIQAAYGAMALVPQEFDGGHVSDMYTILRPRDSSVFNIVFFGFLAERAEMRHAAYISSNGFFAERLRLNFDPHDFLRRKILIPPTVAEQQKIAAVLTTADREIDLLEQQIAALREQKKGLMQKLLTGKIRIKVKAEQR